jgi:alanyl-tRNA synthetase
MINMFDCGRAIEAHIERKKSKLDYKMAEQPTEEQVSALQQSVNEVINMNLPVTVEYATQSEVAGRFNLDRLPEGASEQVRIVHVGNYDECLCIGAHVENTSEIGQFVIISHSWDEQNHIWRMRFKLVR